MQGWKQWLFPPAQLESLMIHKEWRKYTVGSYFNSGGSLALDWVLLQSSSNKS